MKKIFLAGSRKFFGEIQELAASLKEKGVGVELGRNWDQSAEDTLKTEREALMTAFQKIDKADILYVYSKDGYIGKTVAMEIAYAFAREKEIISSQKIAELSAQALVSKVVEPEKLLELLKD